MPRTCPTCDGSGVVEDQPSYAAAPSPSVLTPTPAPPKQLAGIHSRFGVVTLTAIEGKRLGAIRLNDQLIGLAVRVKYEGGTLYAQNEHGRWLRWTGGNWEQLPNPNDAPSAEPRAAVCCVCGAPEDRIIDGRVFCADRSHNLGNAPVLQR
ncbi:MAG TPA: hypothetical protein VF930_05865 [Stellaceae bacterium]